MQLETLRVAAGWSRQFVADQMNVSRHTIWLWENGKAIPAADKAVRLARMFGVSVEELMEGKQ